jgi:hypothetical protein
MPAIEDMGVLNSAPCALSVNTNNCSSRRTLSVYFIHRQMLDTYRVIQYTEAMTTTQHPQIYYTVRSIVRWTFWTGVVFLGVVFIGRSVDTAPARCDIQLERNFTWTNDKGVDISKCSAPHNVVLRSDGTWGWEQ